MSDDWSTTPCSTCLDSPCCRRLPLERLRIQTRADLDRTAHLLGHRWIEVGLKDDGTWTLFYARPCRHLDGASSQCRVHGTLAQPRVCREFTAWPCWYRRVFAQHQSLEFARFDQARLRRLAAMLSYDRFSGEIAAVPAWEEMLAVLAALPPDDPSSRAAHGAPVSLFFPLPPPRLERQRDLFAFRRVFPGVRVIRGRIWLTVVESFAPPGLSTRAFRCPVD